MGRRWAWMHRHWKPTRDAVDPPGHRRSLQPIPDTAGQGVWDRDTDANSKKGSNKEWEHPHDPDARITKMKDGRTHLAHKVEHAADMKTGAILAVTVQGADQGGRR